MTTTTINQASKFSTDTICCRSYDAIDWALAAAKRGRGSSAFELLAAAECILLTHVLRSATRESTARRCEHVMLEIDRAAREVTRALYPNGWTVEHCQLVHAMQRESVQSQRRNGR